MTLQNGKRGKQLVEAVGSLAVAGIAIHFLLPAATLFKLPTVAPVAIAQTSQALAIYNDGELTDGYGMGVDTGPSQLRDWAKVQGDGSLCMAYPPNQDWGAVFITFGGDPKPPRERIGKDFSSYKTLAIDMKGERGGEKVWIGLKDQYDRDDGSETKIPVSLTSGWKTYTFPLGKFKTADLTKLYVVTEFVFEGDIPAETVCFNKIEYRR